MSVSEVAMVVSTSVVVGGAAVAAMKMLIRDTANRTKTLEHNGGSSVADNARAAKEISAKTDAKLDTLNDRLTHWIIDMAAKNAKQDAEIAMLMAERRTPPPAP